MSRVSSRSAAFFDLDKTIIARSSTLAFSRPFYAGGLINRRAVLRGAYAHFLFVAGGADHDQMERMREYLSRMVAGWDVQQVRDIVAETLTQLIEPVVYREATALIEEHHRAGRDVVIVSSSGAEVVEPIGAMLGADHVVATRMVVEDGRYTGQISYYAYGEHKASAVRELAQSRGYDLDTCYAYSDSITDVPMLAAVGNPCAVNPDRALRKEAVSRGWPVVDFTHPVRLRDRMADRMPHLDLPRFERPAFEMPRFERPRFQRPYPGPRLPFATPARAGGVVLVVGLVVAVVVWRARSGAVGRGVAARSCRAPSPVRH